MRWGTVAAALWLVSCASSFPDLRLSELPGAKDYPTAERVVLLDELEVHFAATGPEGAPEAVTTTRTRTRILKPTELPPLTAYYSRTFSRVERIRGRVVAPDGTERPLDTSKQSDRTAFSGGVLFTDGRLVTVPVPPVPVGAVFESEIVERDLDLGVHTVSFTFGDRVPVEVARVVVVAPADWDVRWRTHATDGQLFSPTIETVGAHRRWTFERTKLPAFKDEVQGVSWRMALPRLSLRLDEWTQNGVRKRALPTPEALSRWSAVAYAAKARRTPDMEREVARLLKEVPDSPREKARVLYEYACRRVQYCAVEIGYGGWIPHDSGDVHATKLGDCKDKATYLHTLLGLAGIESSPTLIYAHDGTPKPFSLPSLGANFNHAILAVHLPEGTVYADPTHRTVPFGELPPSDQGAPVLQLTAKGEALKRTPESGPQDNVHAQRLELALKSDGAASGRFTITARGANAVPFKRRVLHGNGALDTFITGELSLRTATVGNVVADEASDFALQTRFSGEVSTQQMVSRGQTAALLRLSDFLTSSASIWDESRKVAVVYPTRQTRELEMSLTLPPGTFATHLPEDVDVDSPFGRFQLTWRASGDSVRVVRRLVRSKRTIPPEQLKDANRFFTQVLLAEAKPAVLRLAPELAP